MTKQDEQYEVVELDAVSKDMQGLRDALFDEMNLIRQNKVPFTRGRVQSILAKRIIESWTLELIGYGVLDKEKIGKLKRIN